MLRKALLLLLVLVLIPYISKAEIKTYTHTVKQAFGGSQSPDDARIGAIAKAKREVLEKAGTYLESMTIVRESVVEKDEILALAAGVLKSEIVSEKKFLEGNEFGIYVTAKVDVDTSILEERVKELLGDRVLLGKYQDSQKREKELLAKIARLEEENRKISSSPASVDSQKKEELKKQFRETRQGLTAIEWFNKSLALFEKGSGQYTDPNQALIYLNKAESLESGSANLYNNRGLAYGNLGKYQRAIEDYNQAIRLDPNFVTVYNNRGIAYNGLRNYQKAIKDFNKAISLDPKDALAYYNRGRAYSFLGQYQRAIEDNSQAIRLDPNFVLAYYNRGLAYGNLGKYQRAIEDYNQAIRLDPNFHDAYSNRGSSYHLLSQRESACKDWRKACELGNCSILSWAKKEGHCQ